MRRLWTLVLLVLAGCNLTTGTLTPAPTPDLPRVEVLSVENGARFYPGTAVEFDIVARDDTVGVSRVELRIDGMLLNTSESPSPQPVYRVLMDWVAEGVGRHVASLIAYRSDGTPSDELFLSLEVVSADATAEATP